MNLHNDVKLKLKLTRKREDSNWLGQTRTQRVRLLGDPVLRTDTPVETVFDEKLADVVDRMTATLMKGRVGVGLAAPQVGLSRRVVVYDAKYAGGPGYLINPEILKMEGSVTEGEACLSFPGEYFDIERAAFVRFRTQSLDGEWHEYQGEDLLARLVQHETDHLLGKLVVDLLPRTERFGALMRFDERVMQQFGARETQASMREVGEMFETEGWYLRRR